MVIAEVRFILASLIMLFFSHFIFNNRLPAKREWKQLMVYGFFNIAVYLGLYVVAMQSITAGIGSLAVASNPVFISFLSVLFFKKSLHYSIVISIIVCTLGVACASWPLIGNASVNVAGLFILLISMLSYSIGALYFSSRQWNDLSLLTINGWQTLFGGIFLLPVTIVFYKNSATHFDIRFWLSVGWLVIPVSIFAVQLWLRLLKINAVRAGLWLFLCPLFGFMIAAMVLKETINAFTIAGVVLVIAGLLLSRINSNKNISHK